MKLSSISNVSGEHLFCRVDVFRNFSSWCIVVDFIFVADTKDKSLGIATEIISVADFTRHVVTPEPPESNRDTDTQPVSSQTQPIPSQTQPVDTQILPNPIDGKVCIAGT